MPGSGNKSMKIKQIKLGKKIVRFIDDRKTILQNAKKIEKVSFGNEKEIQLKVKNSYYTIIAAYENEIIGFARVISDGLYIALIMDVEVGKDFRGIKNKYGKTVGIILIENILEKLRRNIIGRKFVSICEYSESSEVRKWFENNFRFVEIKKGWTELGTTALAKDYIQSSKS